MTDERRTHARPRARPVLELPAELLERGDELTRRWIVALLRARPLEAIGALPLAALAQEAPALCVQVLRSMQSDGELARLIGAGAGDSSPALRIPALVGAADADAVVRAVEALRGVLWEALLERLREPTARDAGDLGDRLAHVCAATLEVAVAASERAWQPAAAESEDGAPPSLRARSHETVAREAAHARGADARATIVDELAVGVPAGDASRPPSRAEDIEIRDERASEGPAAWIRSIGAQLQQFERDRLSFAVLLVEVVRGEETSRGAGVALLDRVERELSAALGARGSVTRERSGRYWLVMADTDTAAAHQLAQRVARAAESGATDAAATLQVAVGVAVCPDDGRQASTLAAHADVGLYADRSAVRAAGRRRGSPVGERA